MFPVAYQPPAPPQSACALERRTLPAGSLYVPLDSELANIAIALLEPESPDSLFAWGELSSCLEQKEYMDTRVLDPLAEQMLAVAALRELLSKKW